MGPRGVCWSAKPGIDKAVLGTVRPRPIQVGVLVGVVTNTVAAVTTGPKLVEALKCFC